ncbi:MAG: L28 family ribosomal protein [Patescibacteria group bacterium]|nr:L28 family ribosomal protein [Patescibacteria group bacterium]
MARTCDICHRGSTVSISRSHSNIATRRKKFINLQTRSINGQRLTICSNCLKTQTKRAK